MDEKVKEAYGKAVELTNVAKRNPKVGNMSPKQRVGKFIRRPSETGSPEPVNRVTRAKHNAAMQDFLEDRGLANLPRLSERSETGGPKEDLNEISSQLTKASNMHASQSERVGNIAKKMK
jgi:hypothetical protein